MAANLFPGRDRFSDVIFNLALATDAASRARGFASVDHAVGYAVSVDNLLRDIDSLTKLAEEIRRDRRIAETPASNRSVNPSTRDAADA